MAPRISQADRFTAALAALRAGPCGDGRDLEDVPERRAYLERLVASKWFYKRFGYMHASRPIHLTRGYRWEAVILMRVAFILQPRPWGKARPDGGAWYRREQAAAFLLLVQHKLGREAAKQLRALYREHGVKHYPRRMHGKTSAAVLRHTPAEQIEIRNAVAQLLRIV